MTACVTYDGTHQAEFLGVPATGKAVTWSIIDIWRVKAGKIVYSGTISRMTIFSSEITPQVE